jgi:hypothetical protein
MFYSSRDLRAVDLLAILLVGFGVVAGVFGILDSDWAYFAVGIGLIILGFALNQKLLAVSRTQGVDVEAARSLRPDEPS